MTHIFSVIQPKKFCRMMYNVLGIVEKERDLCVSVGDISFSISNSLL